ncbi:MAG: bifunctional (p)ppGpp synthetase/guanosine-3',5'-bis(diphosphate) 3'-pyrophosphohydrolase [Candidatus Hydrogenedentota bacterium]|nr:MAG: bifunctional (p)ppGpp synthetase/guanosine-3',5'-bis(diphosphate) 3'-pyrophosphohydrolase [Candidatus Hydrogenedentota bacterium]
MRNDPEREEVSDGERPEKLSRNGAKVETTSPFDLTPEVIKNLLLSYNPGADTHLIDRAYHFAREAHQGQYRASGDPYFTHPVEVAIILAEHRFDAVTLAAALLHDVVEDCGVTPDRLEKEFGAEIRLIVEGVTKISTLAPQTRGEARAENLRRLLVAVAKDVRVLLIKLADRLHNMRTITFLPREKRERISRETLEIYAPLANRMGMSAIQAELEDLGFKHADPELYGQVARQVEGLVGQRRESLREAVEILRRELKRAGIEAEVTARTKEIYSVYRKMQRRNRPIGEIFDLLGMRVLVRTVKECYAALGIVHSLWHPMSRRFKDYIALPKPNMYQAIHTTVLGPGEGPLEIQIKTHQMHLTAEEGIAAHWQYKADGPVDERLGWLRQILEWQRDAVTPQEFMDSLKIDLYPDQVFVLTPKGDIIELPAGATPIDLAYQIHTEIGDHISGAKADGRIIPITSRLTSGTVIEVLTSKNAHPSRDWLDVVATPKARQKIRHYLKEKGADDLRRHGLHLLQAELNRRHIKMTLGPGSESLATLAERMNYSNSEALLEAVGFGRESVAGVINRLETPREVGRRSSAEKKTSLRRREGATENIIIEGTEGLIVRIAGCCHPVPGDPILGYISRGRGVTVHHASCSNIRLMAERETEKGRFVEASWGRGRGRYAADIRVECDDRIGILAELTRVFASQNASVLSASVKTAEIGHDLFTVAIDSPEHLDRILEALRRVPGVRDARRQGR